MPAIDQALGSGPTAPEANPMSALLDSDYGLSLPTRGEIREGVVARITPSEILVDVGAKSEGVITGRELDSLEEATRKALATGQKILVYVMDPEDRNGNIVLSLNRARVTAAGAIHGRVQCREGGDGSVHDVDPTRIAGRRHSHCRSSAG